MMCSLHPTVIHPTSSKGRSECRRRSSARPPEAFVALPTQDPVGYTRDGHSVFILQHQILCGGKSQWVMSDVFTKDG